MSSRRSATELQKQRERDAFVAQKIKQEIKAQQELAKNNRAAVEDPIEMRPSGQNYALYTRVVGRDHNAVGKNADRPIGWVKFRGCFESVEAAREHSIKVMKLDPDKEFCKDYIVDMGTWIPIPEPESWHTNGEVKTTWLDKELAPLVEKQYEVQRKKAEDLRKQQEKATAKSREYLKKAGMKQRDISSAENDPKLPINVLLQVLLDSTILHNSGIQRVQSAARKLEEQVNRFKKMSAMDRVGQYQTIRHTLAELQESLNTEPVKDESLFLKCRADIKTLESYVEQLKPEEQLPSTAPIPASTSKEGKQEETVV